MHRAAEMHKALDKEWHIRDEALLRHREELDTHKLALMQQISEREELLETQQTSILVSAVQDVCRAQEKANVRLNAADAVSSLSAGKIFVLERQVESLRNRLRHLEKEAAAAKLQKNQQRQQLQKPSERELQNLGKWTHEWQNYMNGVPTQSVELNATLRMRPQLQQQLLLQCVSAEAAAEDVLRRGNCYTETKGL